MNPIVIAYIGQNREWAPKKWTVRRKKQGVSGNCTLLGTIVYSLKDMSIIFVPEANVILDSEDLTLVAKEMYRIKTEQNKAQVN